MLELRPQGGSGRSAERSHEARDLRVVLVVLFGLALTATLVGSHYLLRAVFRTYSSASDLQDRERHPLREGRLRPPEPRLETHPAEELEALRKEEDRRLETYGWIDRNQKVLRIPIERAMEQLIRRGVPTRAPAKAAD